MSKCSLYRHYDSDGALLYVGISLSAVARLSQHSIKPWAEDIARVDVQWFDSRKDAEEAERTAIYDERPLHNVRHVPPLNAPSVASLPAAELVTADAPESFAAARRRLRMSCAQLAAALGVSTKTIANWVSGRFSIPRTITLAMYTLQRRAQKDG